MTVSELSQRHVPVMLREAVDALAVRDGGIYVDGTFGRGGYSRAIMERSPQATVYGIDRDEAAIAAGQGLAREFAPRLNLMHGLFGDMDAILASRGVRKVDGVVLDLGVSSPQLDDADRGFSFRADGPLDMRMGLAARTAADIVNSEDEKSLADMIFRYGEERHSRRVARRIVAARKAEPFTRTAQLAEVVRSAVPRSADGIDPATRTFQALRIAVNGEMDELGRGLAAAERVLAPRGRLAVVSFHSLEDRCVKEFMRHRSVSRLSASRHSPPASDAAAQPSFVLVSRKPVPPSEEETSNNPRARSAKLRVAERTEANVADVSAMEVSS